MNRWFKFSLFIFIFLTGFLFGVARLLISLPDNSGYDKLLGQKITFTGRIAAEPSVRDKTTQLVVQPNNGNSNLLLITSSYPEYHYGDEVTVSGKLASPKNFATDSGKIFDYV